MEREIGEIFKYDGEWFQCVEDGKENLCFNCDLYDEKHKLCNENLTGNCHIAFRKDSKSVIFKKLEKVRKPHSFGRKLMQPYKLYVSPVVPHELDYFVIYSEDNKTIEIEIKQDREDMEENANNRGNCSECGDTRFEVIARAKEDLFKSTNIERNEKEVAVIDNILFRCYQMGWLDRYKEEKRPNLKPFDLEAAKAGKPVRTRDGRKARVICYDRQSDHGFPIVALVENTGAEKDEDVRCYRLNGAADEPSYNLMMLPEKKEGWVNVYKVTNGYESRSIFTTKEDAIKKVTGAGYVNTVKIQWEE